MSAVSAVENGECSIAAEGFVQVNNAQKFFTWAGYTLLEFGRMAFRSVEQLKRVEGRSTAARVGLVAKAALAAVSVAICSIPGIASYFLASALGKGRFEIIGPANGEKFPCTKNVLKVLSWNMCLQDPMSALTGDVVTPFEPVDKYATRIEALVAKVAEEDPDVLIVQEGENLAAQTKLIEELRSKGYVYFVRDWGSTEPVRNNSGQFAAFKEMPTNIRFVPYPDEDRAGLSKWSSQGALVFKMGNVTFASVHLNYNKDKENQDARIRQLFKHVFPALGDGRAVIMGDFNFHVTAGVLAENRRDGWVNAVEGQETCFDMQRLHGGAPGDSEMIDGIVHNPEFGHVSKGRVVEVSRELSDHNALYAEVSIGNG